MIVRVKQKQELEGLEKTKLHYLKLTKNETRMMNKLCE